MFHRVAFQVVNTYHLLTFKLLKYKLHSDRSDIGVIQPYMCGPDMDPPELPGS